ARRHRHDTHAAEAGAVGTASAPEAGDASLPPGRGDEGLRHIRQRRERARLEGGLARLAEGVTSVSSRTDHIQIARVIGIPIYLHFSWLIIFGLIAWTLSTGYFPAQSPDLPASSYWAKGLVASLLFFVSILLHELAHAVVARRQGLRTRSITLFVFGGVAQLEKDPRDGRAEFWMAAAGPVASLALAGLFYALESLPFLGPSAAAVAKYLA